MNKWMNRNSGTIVVVIYIVAILGFIVFGVWVALFANCHSIGWMPLRELPVRCIEAVR